MNKLFTKIMATVTGFAMAIGVGVGVADRNASPVHAANYSGTFAKTDIVNLVPGDIIVISNNNSKAMSNDNGTASAPNATSVTISNNNIVNPSETLIWTFGKSGDNYTFLAGTSGDNYLYCTNTNNGVRVGTNANKAFTIDGGYLKNVATSRYVGVYNNQDWRCYASSGVNIANQTFGFYKLQASKTLSSISVKTAPTKTVYYAGEFFDPTGLELTATYSDASTATIDYATYGGDFTFTPSTSTALTTDNSSVSITYGGKSTSQAITVNPARVLSSISISGYETSFSQGDSFEFGGTVTANYSNDTHADVTALATFNGYNMSEIGEQTVTVSYSENEIVKTAEYTITVNAITSVSFVAGTDKSDSLSLTKTGITISLSGGTLSRDDNYRVYANQSLTITSTIGNIKSIDFDLDQAGDFEPSYTNILNSTWSKNSTSQVRIAQIDVELQPTTPSLELDKTSIELKTIESNGKTVTATVYNVDNPEFIWTKADNNITIEVSTNDNVSVATIKPNSLIAVDTSVTVSIKDTSLTETVSVSISLPEPGETAGTAYTVAQAIQHIDDVLGDDSESAGNDGKSYYVTGIISRFFSNSVNNNGQISYYISADGTTSGAELEAYNGKGLNGASFNAIDDIHVGDTVIIYGQLKKYKTTYEFEANNYIVSLTPAPRVNSITLTPASITVEPSAEGNVADLFTSVVINQDEGSNKSLNDITWSSNNNSVFYIENGQYLAGDVHRSSTTINASIDGKVYGSATVIIIDSSIYSIEYNITEEWVLVTDPSTLVAGDRVILTGVKNDVIYAAGLYAGGNNVPADTENTLTVSNDKATGVVSTMVYTLEEGTVDGSVAFKDNEDNYLYAAGGTSSNHMKTQTTIDGNSSFILNSDGSVVAQGTSTHNYMRYNNGGDSNLFSCYTSSSSTGDLVTFYKLTGGEGVIDLPSAKSYAKLQARETGEGNELVVDQVSMRLGLRISEADWNEIDSTLGVSEYGVMLFRTDNVGSVLTVKEYFELGEENVTISRRDANSISPEEGYYDFSVKININNPANFDRYYCAAPFVVAGGNYYFFQEVRATINDLADNYNGSDLSTEALLYLATTNS